jgi:phosphoribosylaminoimidazolecarboxamide formyltransferase / IMP cyclohydrolase
MADIAPIKTALISVSDKTALEALARALVGHGVKLLSTGGTASALRKMGLDVTDVSDVTGFPEIMDGRVKTLHPSVHGALLSIRGNAEHEKARRENGIGLIDLLIVNLYPFEETLAKGASRDDMIENIDVGGPAMIRGASKNHQDVTVVVDPVDYDAVLAELMAHKGTTLALRRKLAAKAFARTASYDAAISAWMANEVGEPMSEFFAVGGRLRQTLRYGENPHQSASVYSVSDGRIGVLTAMQIQGKELSYNNINDADAALDAISEFDGAKQAACVIVKHANPCGVAIGTSLTEAYAKALSCDVTSAFGGILAFNRKLDGKTAEEIAKLFTEVIIAPGADDDAKTILAAKKNLRLLLLPEMPNAAKSGIVAKSIAGGLLVQSRDSVTLDEATLRIVSKRKPSDTEMRDLRFAWTIAKHVKSNAIVFARDGMTTGIGAGQMSRIDSTRIAVSKSLDAARAAGGTEPWAKGSVLASDAFFPFADGIEAAAQAGATAIIQPGGAMRDDDVIKCADDHGLAMVFTGIRHFRH